MYGIDKKFEIEMKLKKEMSNIQELKAAAKRSTVLANDVCNVLGACEQRLQQLEEAVLPLYGNTSKLQQINHNMERTMKALDHVINYYMMSRELADLIQAGPHTTTNESLNIYLEALDKLAEAQNYFNKNNPQSVELENIKQLYNTGVMKLENAFEELLSRNTRPLSPTALMDLIAVEEDSSADSISITNSGSSNTSAAEGMRLAAGWLSAAGRPPLDALLRVRVPAASASMQAFDDYLRTRTLNASPLMRVKNTLLHRNDSTTKKTSKIQKIIEKGANKIIAKASQTLEQSTGLNIGGRRSIIESLSEEGRSGEEREAEVCCSLARGALCVLRREQRAVLGLVPLARLGALLGALGGGALGVLAAGVERAGAGGVRAAGRAAPQAALWPLRRQLAALQPEVARALQPASPAPYTAILSSCTAYCVRSLEEWVEGVRADGAGGAVDGTVHQLAAAALAHCAALANHVHTIGQVLANEPSYSRVIATMTHVQDKDKDAAFLAVYMRKLLAQLNLALRSKSEQYPEALKAIFLLNNTLYLLQGLQRSDLLEVLQLAEPECEKNYRDMIHEYKNAYLQSWNKVLSHLVLEETLPAKLRDKDRQILKDKFASFNRELEESSRAQVSYSVPDAELRAELKRANKQALLPPYSRFHDRHAALPFTKNPDKYVKYTPLQVANILDSLFDEAA